MKNDKPLNREAKKNPDIFQDETSSPRIYSRLTVIVLNHLKNVLTDFNDMSYHLRLFNDKKLGNCVHCTFMFTFLCSFSLLPGPL